VQPSRYGATDVHPKTDGVNPSRDDLEIRLIHEFLAAGRPVLGICRGFQILNVALGGRLLQHVPDELAGRDAEVHARKNGYDAVHAVELVPATRMGQALRGATEVNSSHHQAVDPCRLAPDLTVTARSPAGILEAAECFTGGRRVAAVQWHPERLAPEHPASAKLRDFYRSLAG
jgi:gamma-glutamyl-gamma-aminobutyrate hydrolase PuuD